MQKWAIMQSFWLMFCDNISKFGPDNARKIFWIQTNGSTDTASAYIHLIKSFSGGVDDGRKLFLHTKWTAATTDLTGNCSNIFYMDHFNGFFSDRSGCGF